MESEKVKEILCRLHCKLLGDRKNEINHEEINCVGEVITLINELESKNEKLKQHKRELEGGQQDLIKRIAELEKLCNKTYEDLTKEIDRLENRIKE